MVTLMLVMNIADKGTVFPATLEHWFISTEFGLLRQVGIPTGGFYVVTNSDPNTRWHQWVDKHPAQLDQESSFPRWNRFWRVVTPPAVVLTITTQMYQRTGE